jgi:hypothetical protein
MSGIFMGNAIMVRTINEGGLLPSRYKDTVALQATAVDHSIDATGWTTSISTIMRSLPESNAPGSIAGSVDSSKLIENQIFEEGDLPISNPLGDEYDTDNISSRYGGRVWKSYADSLHIKSSY